MNKNGKHVDSDETVKPTMSFKEVIQFLGISYTTAYKLIKRGLLTKHQKPFGLTRIYFMRDEVLRLKEMQEATTGENE